MAGLCKARDWRGRAPRRRGAGLRAVACWPRPPPRTCTCTTMIGVTGRPYDGDRRVTGWWVAMQGAAAAAAVDMYSPMEGWRH